MSEQHQIKHLEKPDMPRVYSNYLIGAKTIFDFRLTFSEVVDVTDTETTVEDRVVVTIAWGQAKVLRDFLTEVIANIEGINGEIKPVLLSSADEPESAKLPIQ